MMTEKKAGQKWSDFADAVLPWVIGPPVAVVGSIVAFVLAVAAVLGFGGYWIWKVLQHRRSKAYREEEAARLCAQRSTAPSRPLPPETISMSATVYRFQEKSRVFRGDQMFKMFEDGPWKWRGQQRFAGEVEIRPGAEKIKLNVGHFFATSIDTARAEMLHYVPPDKLSDYSLITLAGHLGKILDLTTFYNVLKVASEMDLKFTDKTRLNDHDIYKTLITSSTGGNKFTSAFGHYASQHGYNGIVFCSARALKPEHAERLLESEYYDEVMEDYEKGPIYEEIRNRVGQMCVVAFSGSVVIRAIEKYHVDDGPWEANPYYRWTESDLDAKLEYGASFHAQPERRTYRLTLEKAKLSRREWDTETWEPGDN